MRAPCEIDAARAADPLRLAGLIHSTDPHIFDALHGGDRDLALRHLAHQWQSEAGLFSHVLARGAWMEERLSGITIGFTAQEQASLIEPYLEQAQAILSEDEFSAAFEWWASYGFLNLPAIPDDAWYLQNLAVDPAFRGLGLGAALLEDCFSRAREAGLPRLHLDVFDGNPAIGLYRRLGMQVIVETRVLPLEIQGFPTHLRMEKRL